MSSDVSSRSRSYLSIREVLDLLVNDFPEITISKIRFLESRGLIHPERTPSGYRKFYETDVERLRWILRQQREHFLPLKVIKGRLEQELGVSGDSLSTQSLFDDGMEDPSEGALVGAFSAAPRALEMRSARFAAERTPTVVAEPSYAAPTHRVAPKPSPSEHEPALGLSMAERRPPSAAPTPAHRRQEVPAANPATDQKASEPTVEATEPVEGPADATAAPRRSGRSVPLPTGASFNSEELCRAASIEPLLLGQLEEYGLVAGREIAGVRCFEEDALVIARLAGQFARFGIEPRHLRSIKHAAEREAGLYAQVVTPLLRQRNPDARQRAVGELRELSELGSSLQSAFVQAELRNLSGG